MGFFLQSFLWNQHFQRYFFNEIYSFFVILWRILYFPWLFEKICVGFSCDSLTKFSLFSWPLDETGIFTFDTLIKLPFFICEWLTKYYFGDHIEISNIFMSILFDCWPNFFQILGNSEHNHPCHFFTFWRIDSVNAINSKQI